ncbi:MAG: histidinol-phosphate transaminase [Gammaproteobacteria bacterium]
MSVISNLIRTDLLNFSAYSSARDEAKQGKIWLNANESPWDNDQQIRIEKLNRYPEKQREQLNTRLADIYGIRPEQMLLLRGSDEAIDLLIRLFCRAEHDSILICPPTFGMYEVCANLQGISIMKVPLIKSEGFQLDITSILQKINQKTKIIFLCSPNNPTGNLLSEKDIINLCQELQENCIIVVDEAYIEFANFPSLAKHLASHSNLAILRTLSKVYGLAAARCGALLASKELIEWVKKIMPPYPLSSLTMEAVYNATSSFNLTKLEQQIQANKYERARLFNTLKKLRIMKHIWPSEANFLLLETVSAQVVMDECNRKGIVLRDMRNKPDLENCIRTSIGLANENDKLIEVLTQM